MPVKKIQFDVVVVGAGVAGCGAAFGLAEKGFQVGVIEKLDPMPESIKGELLQPGGVASLQKLGLEDCLLDIDAQPVYGFAVVEGGRERVLPYPSPWGGGRANEHAGLGVEGRSFHHHRLVKKMRARVRQHSQITWISGSVRDLLMEEDRVVGAVCKTSDGEMAEISASLTVMAGGRSRKLLERLGVTVKPEKAARSIGVEVRGGSLPHSHHGHVFLLHPSPALGYQISSDCVRLLIDVPHELQLSQKAGLMEYVTKTVGPQLPESLQPALMAAMEEGQYQTMQSLVLPPMAPNIEGVVSLGDALSMRHPLTGGGMTVALNDAFCLVDSITSEAIAQYKAQRRAIRSFYRKREPLAATVDMLSGALYHIFREDQDGAGYMRDAVMEYWQRGGAAVDGPMSLLAGLSPSPYRLLRHYSAVTWYGALNQLTSEPSSHHSLGRLGNSLSLGWEAVRTMAPHLPRAVRLFTL